MTDSRAAAATLPRQRRAAGLKQPGRVERRLAGVVPGELAVVVGGVEQPEQGFGVGRIPRTRTIVCAVEAQDEVLHSKLPDRSSPVTRDVDSESLPGNAGRVLRIALLEKFHLRFRERVGLISADSVAMSGCCVIPLSADQPSRARVASIREQEVRHVLRSFDPRTVAGLIQVWPDRQIVALHSNGRAGRRLRDRQLDPRAHRIGVQLDGLRHGAGRHVVGEADVDLAAGRDVRRSRRPT